MENVGGGKEWEGQPPVLFETEIYHFFIEFNCSLLGTPRINHPKREIAECFDYHKGMLTGSINFLNNLAEMYYTGTDDTKPNLDIQSIKYSMPLIKGKINGVYKVSAINAARKRDKEINEKTTNDGVRFFLMLDEFIPFGDSIDHHNTIHNGDWMTIEEARNRYNNIKKRGVFI